MRAMTLISLLLLLTFKMKAQLFKILAFSFLVLTGFQANAQDPVVTVRFAKPEYVCATQTYSLDVEFQCNTAGEQLFEMNVRFFYADTVLEFLSFGEFVEGYGPDDPDPPVINTLISSSGMLLFGFPGPAEFVSGAVEKISSSSIYLSTTGWTKIFNVSFHVDDPDALNSNSFCPIVIWDKKKNPADGGISGGEGVLITVVNPIPPPDSAPTTEHVVQFNWQYDSIPGYPYGYPVNTNCISTLRTYAPATTLPMCGSDTPGMINIPVTVTNFTSIGAFALVFEYDPAVMTYVNNTPNAIFTTANGLLNVSDSVSTAGKHKIKMNYQRLGNNAISLSDEAHLSDLHFNYISGSTDLTWKTSGNSCHYSDSLLLTKCDQPYSDYFINGNVASAEFIWTGDYSSDWDTGANWINNVIPDQFINVTIDTATNPEYWPTYTGNFTLGEDCKNLTLIGNSQLTVTGDLTINPGHTLNLTGSGILQIGGDWTNSGIFNPGSGTVEFTGTEDGTIAEGVPPGNYIAGYVLSTFTAGMTPITGGSAGPTGNEAHSDVGIGFAFNYLGIDYSQVRINTNGWLSLNLTGNDTTSNDNILLFNTSAPTTALAPWWDDLKADASTTIAYLTEGTVPPRVFTAEWKNILAYSSGATARLNFQVKLYETTNIIEFCFGSVISGTHHAAEGASIGIKDATGGPGNFIEATHNSTNLILTFLNSEFNWPVINYRFSPPAENTMEEFYKLLISKVPGKFYMQRDVKVTGSN